MNVASDSTTNTSWAENTLTWNNKPTTSGTTLDTETVNATADKWYDWTVSSHVRTQRQAGATAVTLALFGSGSATSAAAVFDSKENTNDPQLVVTTLLAPTTLAGSATSPTQVNLTWVDASDNESGFKVERSANGGSTWTVLATTAANATSYSDTTAAGNTAYQYQVRSTVTSPAVDSGPTGVLPVTTPVPPPPVSPPPVSPPPPTGGTTTTLHPTADAFVRDGDASTTNFGGTNFGSAATLEVKTVAAGGYNRDGYLKFDLTGVPATGVASAALRLYGVGSKNSGSLTSVPVSVFKLTDPTAVWTESGLNWNNSPALSGTGSVTTALGTANVPLTTADWQTVDLTSFINAERAAGRTSVTVGLHKVGTTDDVLATLNSREATSNQPELVLTAATAPTTPPAAPTNLTIATTTATQVVLTWTDNSTTETGFVIERASNSSFNQNLTTFSAGVNATSYTDTTVAGSMVYYYRVRAVNAAGASADATTNPTSTPSAVPIVTTPASSAAAGNTVTTTGTTLSVGTSGGTGAVTYYWEVVGAGASTVGFSSANGTTTGSSVGVSFTTTGTFTFQVTATDGDGNSTTSTVGVGVVSKLTKLTVGNGSGLIQNDGTGGGYGFTAGGQDQFGGTMSVSPSAVSWSASGGGSINQSGQYTFPASLTGHVTVTATANGATGSALIAVGKYVGTVFGDANVDGHQDGNELGLQGWQVYLENWDGNGAGEPSDTTDALGQFAIDGDDVSSHQDLVVVKKSGWQESIPGGFGFNKGKAVLTGVSGYDSNNPSSVAGAGSSLSIVVGTGENASIHVDGTVAPDASAYGKVLYKTTGADGSSAGSGTLSQSRADLSVGPGLWTIGFGVDTNSDGQLDPAEVTQRLQANIGAAKLKPTQKTFNISPAKGSTVTVTVTDTAGGVWRMEQSKAPNFINQGVGTVTVAPTNKADGGVVVTNNTNGGMTPGTKFFVYVKTIDGQSPKPPKMDPIGVLVEVK